MEKSSLKNTLIGLTIVLVAVGSVLGFRYTKKSHKVESVQTISSGKTRGPDSAPIRIVGFSDFQCPACRVAAPILEAMQNEYPGQIQVVFKHFPLRMHVWSAVAHQAAECAAVQGKFWDFYKKIYENQPVWSTLPDPMVSFATYAGESGVNMNDFAQCMADPVIAEKILAEKKEGEVLEVKSTPTFFINGKMFAGPMDLQIAGDEHIRKILGLPAKPKPVVDPAAQAKTEIKK